MREHSSLKSKLEESCRDSLLQLMRQAEDRKEINMTKFVYDDGGRADAGFKGTTGDCVCRAIAIATERPYKEVYDLINEIAQSERTGKRKKGKSNARTGVYKNTIMKVMSHYGWTWHPTMTIGSGCTTHVNADELPKGRLVLNLSKHCTAMIDGVIHDIYDPSRDGTRCVYGYFSDDRQRVEQKERSETDEQRKKRLARLNLLNREREHLEGAIDLLKDSDRYADITEKRQRRLERVNAQIEALS